MKTIAIITDQNGVQKAAEPYPENALRTVCNGTQYLCAETQQDLDQLNQDYPQIP